jgi:hypothetical protein
MMSEASQSEIDLLRRLHRGARVQLTALKQLPERSPEDDLRLRALVRLEQRLMDRIHAVNDNAGFSHAEPRETALHARDRAAAGEALAAE